MAARYSGTLAAPPVMEFSVVARLLDASGDEIAQVRDLGDGTFAGDGSGTINYADGSYDITFGIDGDSATLTYCRAETGRWESTWTVGATTGDPQNPGTFTATRTEVQDGTSCTDQRSVQLDWTPDANTSDAVHDLRISRRVNGEPWVVVQTITDPVTTTTHTADANMYGVKSGSWHTVDFLLELIDGAGNVMDTEVLSDPTPLEGNLCAA